MPMMPSHRPDEDWGGDDLLREYEHFLTGKAEGTIEAYVRTARQVMAWVASRPGNGGSFQSQQLTKTAVELYLTFLEQEGFSLIHRATMTPSKTWLVEVWPMRRCARAWHRYWAIPWPTVLLRLHQ